MLENQNSLCQPKQKIIVSRDSKANNSVKHTAINTKQHFVRQYKLDEIVKTSTCCDFAVLNDELQHAYLIELKGGDLEKAEKQLRASEKILRAELHEYKFFFRCIYRRRGTSGIKKSKDLKQKRASGKVDNKWVWVFNQGDYTEKIS